YKWIPRRAPRLLLHLLPNFASITLFIRVQKTNRDLIKPVRLFSHGPSRLPMAPRWPYYPWQTQLQPSSAQLFVNKSSNASNGTPADQTTVHSRRSGLREACLMRNTLAPIIPQDIPDREDSNNISHYRARGPDIVSSLPCVGTLTILGSRLHTARSLPAP
ncbi:hypothetical protein GQ607_006991, partial [Colletotrichum asianum]